jgi:hypothetical protein
MGKKIDNHRAEFEKIHLVTIKNKLEEPMLNYLWKANQDYLGHLSKVQADL